MVGQPDEVSRRRMTWEQVHPTSEALTHMAGILGAVFGIRGSWHSYSGDCIWGAAGSASGEFSALRVFRCFRCFQAHSVGAFGVFGAVRSRGVQCRPSVTVCLTGPLSRWLCWHRGLWGRWVEGAGVAHAVPLSVGVVLVPSGSRGMFSGRAQSSALRHVRGGAVVVMRSVAVRVLFVWPFCSS